MLKITSDHPFLPTITIDTDDIKMGHGFMAQLGIGEDCYKIELIKMRIDAAVPLKGPRSVRIEEISEIAGQFQVEFLEEGKIVGIDGFSQRDCAALFRLIYGWMNFSLTHVKVKDSITRRILHR